jgi:nitrogen fixation/metabolism regulation signal transduction histidine kinase
MLMQLRRDGSYVSLDAPSNGRLRIRAAVSFTQGGAGGGELLTAAALFPLSEELSALAEAVQSTYSRYGELIFLRGPIEYSFTLSLSVVVLLTLLGAAYVALVFAWRLVAPIQSLVAGTRAVAQGDLDTRLPLFAQDDIGALVESFNDMTRRLGLAREQAQRSAQDVEAARANLAAVLGRLTSGVVVLGSGRQVRLANEAAVAILQSDLGRVAGGSVDALGAENPQLAKFIEVCDAHTGRSPGGWREQIVLSGDSGRRVLMCAATPLPEEEDGPAGYVLVFDDITAMLQAQRDAAWGEVARRLAHEIKNPLTPIQLSAERIRRRCLGTLAPAEAEIVDRATHTIVQQVEAMRDMVNAFSDYARAPDMNLAPLDLNGLVMEVVELYQGQNQPQVRLNLDHALGNIEADRVRIRQLLHNLIRNACDAMEERAEGWIEISTARRGDGADAVAEIRVRDNGPGIEPEMLDRIFEPYVTNKPRGTGLGLAIVRRLVEDHGGSVNAENLAGGGACVSVTLPLVQGARDRDLDSRSRRSGEWR